MPGYLIANLDIRDPALFQKYRDQVAPLIKRFGGRYLVRGGELRSVEGTLPVKRLIVLEFPSLADVQRFYDSDEYRPILQLRLDSCVSDVVLVEGYSEAA